MSEQVFLDFSLNFNLRQTKEEYANHYLRSVYL